MAPASHCPGDEHFNILPTLLRQNISYLFSYSASQETILFQLLYTFQRGSNAAIAGVFSFDCVYRISNKNQLNTAFKSGKFIP